MTPTDSRNGRDGQGEVLGKPSPDSLAYVLYTSGSTGRPKGVQIPQRAVVNLLTSMRREPGLVPEDTFLAVTTLAFDIAALELFLPLTTGACVVIATHEVAADGRRLARLLEDSSATVMQATPATWRMLLGAGWGGNPKLKVLCGGEALPRDLAERLLPLARSSGTSTAPPRPRSGRRHGGSRPASRSSSADPLPTPSSTSSIACTGPCQSVYQVSCSSAEKV